MGHEDSLQDQLIPWCYKGDVVMGKPDIKQPIPNQLVAYSDDLCS